LEVGGGDAEVGRDSAPETLPGTDDTTDTDVEDIPGNDDTAPVETGETEPDTEPDTWPKGCSEVYDGDELQRFDLTFTNGDLAQLQSACNRGSQEYVPVQLTWKDETVAAKARLKGNWSWSCDKMQFVISFNEDDPDARFHGLRKMVFDAPWYDRTFLHERLAFPLFEARGLPHSCVNNAEVWVNGEYYGFYANTERIDREYLERNFELPDGNLYQGGAELKTNEDTADTSRLTALQAARTVDEIAALSDLDEAVAEWATEALIPAMDNYWAGVEINYYLYDHPERGFLWLPYDLDISFGDAAYTSGDLVWPDAVRSDPITYEHYGWGKEALVKTVLSDPYWCDRFVEELALSRAAYDPDEMAVQVDTWAAQIADAVAADERKPFRTSDHRAAVEDLKDFLVDRAAFVDAWLAEGDHCPARW
jgi:hypothetical protein